MGIAIFMYMVQDLMPREGRAICVFSGRGGQGEMGHDTGGRVSRDLGRSQLKVEAAGKRREG